MPVVQSLLLLAVVLAAMLWPASPMAPLENSHYDFWAGRYRAAQDPSLAIVAIDASSLARLGDWPWSRTRMAEVVRRLTDGGAQALGVCVLYAHPETSPGLLELEDLEAELADQKFPGGGKTRKILERLLNRSRRRLDHDDDLIAAIRRARNAVLPLRFTSAAPRQAPGGDPSGLMIINSLKSPAAPEGRRGQLGGRTVDLGAGSGAPVHATGFVETFPELAGKAGALGHINLHADPDGKLRRVPLFIPYQGRLYPAMALQMVLKQMGGSVRAVTIDHDFTGQPLLRAGHLQVPLDHSFGMLLTHDPAWIRQQTYTMADVLDGTVDASVFEGKQILVGITDPSLVPTYRVGGGAGLSLPEITASAMARIRSPSKLSRPAWASLLEIVALIYFAGLLTFVVPRVGFGVGASMVCFFLATWYALGIGLLLGYGYWVRPLGPVLLALLGFVLIRFTTRARRQQAEKLESCKTLGLSYQAQGMLDMAYEQYLQCPVGEKTVKDLLYNLALDFERKRMFNKAMAIYRHIQSGGAFKDIKTRISRLAALDDPLSATVAASKGELSLQMDDVHAKPVFGRYEILSELGQGAMGTVYLGRDPKINRKVAIKTLSYAEVDDSELPEVKARFYREAEAAGRLSHPNIVSIYDAGEEHDMAYIAMELLNGQDLTHHRKPESLLPVNRVLAIVADTAEALDYAHGQGVIHRDIKPGNIMLLKDGRVKVTDFGIARVVDSTATRTGIILGTPSYMSPEQVTDKKLDGRSDLFALGIVFYELLTGTKPFKGDNINATMHAIIHTAHAPVRDLSPEVPGCVAAIVDKLLVKGLTRRFRSARLLLKAIEKCRANMV